MCQKQFQYPLSVSLDLALCVSVVLSAQVLMTAISDKLSNTRNVIINIQLWLACEHDVL